MPLCLERSSLTEISSAVMIVRKALLTRLQREGCRNAAARHSKKTGGPCEPPACLVPAVRRSAVQLGSDFGHPLALEACAFQFLR